MKKFILSALLVFAGLQSTSAQEPQKCGHPFMNPDKMIERLDKKLDLTDKQEKEIKVLFQDFCKDLCEKKDMGRAECSNERQELDNKILEVLNKKQRKEYKAMMEKRNNRSNRSNCCHKPHNGHKNHCKDNCK